MTAEQREKAVKLFNSKSNREKVLILEALSKPWIQQGAIKYNAKTLEEIFVMQDLSMGAKAIADKKADYLSRIMGRRGGAGTTMGGSNRLKPKKTRLKIKK